MKNFGKKEIKYLFIGHFILQEKIKKTQKKHNGKKVFYNFIIFPGNSFFFIVFFWPYFSLYYQPFFFTFLIIIFFRSNH